MAAGHGDKREKYLFWRTVMKRSRKVLSKTLRYPVSNLVLFHDVESEWGNTAVSLKFSMMLPHRQYISKYSYILNIA